MKVAWVTHIIPGYQYGGAEMADFDMISQAPDDVEVTIVPPHGSLAGFDTAVVAGAQHVGHRLGDLLPLEPVVWAHGWQGNYGNCQPLYEDARAFVALTPQHLAWERSWLHLPRAVLNPGWMDTTLMHVGEKRDVALWAHRPSGHKGLQNAVKWASVRGVELVRMSDRPRSEVLDAMATARWFVMLPTEKDGGPRAVIEAQLSGCVIVANELVGWFDEPVDDLRARIDRAAREFWDLVCGWDTQVSWQP